LRFKYTESLITAFLSKVNRNVLAAIRSVLDEDHWEWDAHLQEIELAIRNTVHSATGEALFLTV